MIVYNDVIIERHLHPVHFCEVPDADVTEEGKDASCGDMLTLQLRFKDGVITDGGFSGVGCAFSQASADLMLDLVIGSTKERAKYLSDIFTKMTEGDITEEQLGEIGEANIFRDINDMPSRKRCVLLGWDTLNRILEKY